MEVGDIIIREHSVRPHETQADEYFIYLHGAKKEGPEVLKVGMKTRKYIPLTEWNNLEKQKLVFWTDIDRVATPEEKNMVYDAISSNKQARFVIIRKLFGETRKPRRYY